MLHAISRNKIFNALIDNKPFFDQSVKNNQKSYEKLIETSTNDDYTTCNLLDFSYHHNCYNLTGIDLSRQTQIGVLLNKLILLEN